MDIYDTAFIGDSIIKDPGTLRFVLKKEERSIEYYPQNNHKDIRDK